MRAVSSMLLVSLLLGTSSAVAEVSAPFKLVRTDEDYSYLRDDPKRDEPANAYKFIPLNDDKSVWLSFGGELRERFDSINAAKFGVGTEADSYDLQRLLLSADLHLGDRLRIFGEIGRHDVYGKSTPLAPSDRDGFDTQLLFADIIPDEGKHLTFRVGRQELNFNALQRFVSVREGPNIRQSFDGVRAIWSDGSVSLNVFDLRPVVVEPGSFNDESQSSQRFYGLYGAKTFSPAVELDLYAFQLDRSHVSFQTVLGDESRTSFGSRAAGKIETFDYDTEAILQTGRFAGKDIRAWAFSADSGYTMTGGWSPRWGLRLDIGSGDSDAGDNKLGTFNPLFPKGAYFNETALTSWSNLIGLRPSYTVKPVPGVTLAASVMARWRETTADGVYLQPSTLMPGTMTDTSRWVGLAYQLDASWAVSRYLTLSGEGVVQTVSDTIRRAGGHSVTFAMLVAQSRF